MAHEVVRVGEVGLGEVGVAVQHEHRAEVRRQVNLHQLGKVACSIGLDQQSHPHLNNQLISVPGKVFVRRRAVSGSSSR